GFRATARNHLATGALDLLPACAGLSAIRTHADHVRMPAARMPITGTAQVATLASQLAHSPGYPARLAAKARELAAADRHPPPAAYRAAELAIMRRNFSGPGEPY